MTDVPGCKIPNLRYSDFAARLGSRLAGDRPPLVGGLELTFRCNLRCAHCYVSQPAGDREARRRELTTAEVFGLADAAVDRGCLWMLLTGGEPLLRPDFAEIFLHMKRRGLLVTVFTNGTLLTRRIADLFAAWPPLVVEISLYGSTAEVYERVTGVPGSFARCLQGIDRLAERRVRFRLKTVLLTLNVEDLPGMQRLASDHGGDLDWDPLVNARIDGRGAPTAVRLTPERIVGLEREDPKRDAHFRTELARAEPARSDDGLYTCGAFLHAFHADPYGDLLPCVLLRRPVANLREVPFARAWDELFPAARRARRTRTIACDSCRIDAACDTYVGWAEIETGRSEAAVPFLCELAHLRAAAFGTAGPGAVVG